MNLKSLQTKMSAIQEEIEVLKKQKKIYSTGVSEASTKIEKKTKELTAVKSQMDDLLKDNTVITEHAILRYIERQLGIDLEEIKNKIITDEVQSRIKVLGDGTYPVDGFKIIVKNNKVVTILE